MLSQKPSQQHLTLSKVYKIGHLVLVGPLQLANLHQASTDPTGTTKPAGPGPRTVIGAGSQNTPTNA